MSGASNVLGVFNDLAEISRIVHWHGARLLVDAAQLIAHRAIETEHLGIDYLAFSAHKAYAPFGSGALMQMLIGLLLVASGAAKLWIGRSMKGAPNFPLVMGTGAVSAVIGLVVLLGLNLNFGILLGVELLSSGLALVLLAMHRRGNA